MKISGYTLKKKLGQGAMATVYLALQQSLGRPVALKLLLPTHADSAEFAERFFAEGRIVASIDHRNVITIHNLGIANGYPYISMEYLEGGDLRSRIAGGLDRAQALRLLRQVAEGLGAAHAAGIVHRDVKPANIMFRKDGTAVVTDFGIAKQLEADSDMTMAGTVLGSPSYLSPEQAASQAVDGRSDIYSLGIILYEMLCGRKPYRGDTALETVQMHLQQPVPRLDTRFADLQGLLDRMLAKQPSDRFAGIAELLSQLEGLAASPVPAGTRAVIPSGDEDEPTLLSVTPPPVPSGHRSRPGAVLLSAVLIGTATLGAWQAGWITPPEMPGNDPAPAGVAQADPAPADRVLAASRPAAPDAGRAAIAVATEPPPQVEIAAPGPGSTPPPDPKRVEAEHYLELADQAVNELRLTSPPGDNAYFYLQQAQERLPRDPRIRGLRAAIADRYADLATTRIDKFDYEQANVYIDKGLAIQRGNRRLLELRRKANFTQAPKQLFDKARQLF